MTYADAMERYGSDRPDLRYGLEIIDASDVVRADAAPFVHRRARSSGRPRARHPRAGRRGAVPEAARRDRGGGQGRRGAAG